jgi:hypothetical protein
MEATLVAAPYANVHALFLLDAAKNGAHVVGRKSKIVCS